MHHVVLLLHSYLRWIALVFMFAACWSSIVALRRKSADPPGRVGLLAMILLDLQLTSGLVLYLWPGSIARLALSEPAAALRDSALRFWAVEHLTMMALAIGVVHVGRIASRRAKSALFAHRRAVISWSVALVVIVAAIPWPFRAGVGRPLLRGLGF